MVGLAQSLTGGEHSVQRLGNKRTGCALIYAVCPLIKEPS